MLCKRCQGSGNIARQVNGKIRAVRCSTCGGIGTRHKPKEFYTILRKHLKELENNLK